MSQKNVLLQPSNIHLTNWEEIFLFLKGYAIARQMRNTLIALSVATQLHANQKRKGGAPYIIHPLEVTSYLINLGIDDDVTCAAAILHDVIEDCGIVSPYKDLGEKYIISAKVHYDEKSPHMHLIFLPAVHTKDKKGNPIDKLACSEF